MANKGITRRSNFTNPWNFFGDFDSDLSNWFAPLARTQEEWTFKPAIDVKEVDNAYHIYIDLPGVEKEDIEVAAENGRLTVSGERKSEVDREDKGVQVHERFYGKFSRSFTLPTGVDADAIEANLKNGELFVVLPKKSTAASKKVTIKG